MLTETLSVLLDIRDAARFIMTDTENLTFAEFMDDRRRRQAVLYNFTVIGEAANRLRRRDPEVAQRISDIHQIVGMRHALVHRYDVVDYEIVWRAIQETLPVLREQIEALLPQEDRAQPNEGSR